MRIAEEIINQDSKMSSNPPSSDVLKRSEKEPETEPGEEPRRAVGQRGHQWKTRQGFGRVDRYEVLHPEQCPNCQSRAFNLVGETLHCRAVAQLSERPIEVVEYPQVCCQCQQCGTLIEANLPKEVVPGQDLGVSLQAMLSWLGVYGHLAAARVAVGNRRN